MFGPDVIYVTQPAEPFVLGGTPQAKNYGSYWARITRIFVKPRFLSQEASLADRKGVVY